MAILRSLHTDYIWPFIVVVAALYASALVIALIKKGEYGTFQKIGGLFLLILMDLQLTVGIVLYAVQQRWTGNDILRSYEHPFQMIVAIVLFHIGYRQVKIATEHQKKLRFALIWLVGSMIILGLGLIRITGWLGS